MRIVVTGSSGFIGFNLCKSLLTNGHNVIGIDSHTSDYNVSIKDQRATILTGFPNFQFIKLDLLNEGIDKILAGKKADCLVHLAARDIYYSSDKTIKYTPFLIDNVVGTSKMFELAVSLGVKKFIFGSTFSVYGKTKKTILTEKKILPSPISPHGSSKLAAEHVISFLHRYYKVPAIILRIGSTYGPGMRPFTVIPLIIHRLYHNEPIDFFDINLSRDFIYVDDVVNFIEATFNKRIKFHSMNIATGKTYSLVEVVNKIAVIMGKEKYETAQHEMKFDKFLQKDVIISIDRAKKLLKYTPHTDIDFGLKTTVDYYMKNLDVLEKSTHHKIS